MINWATQSDCIGLGEIDVDFMRKQYWFIEETIEEKKMVVLRC